MMNRAFASAAVMASLLALAAGCQSKTENKTFVHTTLPLPQGLFPGTQYAEHCSAADGFAFSAPGESVDGFDSSRFRYFPSGTGMGVLLFETSDLAGTRRLYASHFDGQSTITQATELFCPNRDDSQAALLQKSHVLFLRSAGEREADALLLVPCMDLDDPAGVDPASNPNIRLYYTYFDYSLRTLHSSASNPDLRWGFDSSMEAIDLSDTEDVHLCGILTDGLVGSGRFPAASAADYRQGHPTTFALIVWSQKQTPSSQERLFGRVFDLSSGALQAPSEVPLDASADPADGIVHSSTALEMDVCGNALFFVRNDSSSGDELLLAALFNPSTGSFMAQSHLLSPQTAPASLLALPPCQTNGKRIFGPDEGLARIQGFYAATGYNFAGETSIMAFQVDPADFTAAGFSAVLGEDLAEADAGAGSGAPWSVQTASPVWTLNRPGTCIFLSFIQPRSEAVATPALWFRAMRTVESGSTPRDLSQDLSAALRVDTDSGSNPVDWFMYPQDLEYRGFQSAPGSFTVVWKQDATGSTDTLRYNCLTADLSPDPPQPPFLSKSAVEGSIAFLDSTLLEARVVLADGGGDGGTAGAADIYYVRDARTGTHASYRAFYINTSAGPETNIGSLTADPALDYQPKEALEMKVVTTPYDPDVSGKPGYSGTHQHVFIREYRRLDSAGSTAWRTRIRMKSSTAALPSDRFLPPATGSASAAPPVPADAPIDRDSAAFSFGSYGDTVCAFFSQGGNIFYYESNPAGAPFAEAAIVDNDLAGEGLPCVPAVFLQEYADAPASFRKALVFWTRTFPGGSDRALARIRY